MSKMTFRKWLILAVLIITVITVTVSYVLAFCGDETVEAVPLAFIGMLATAFTAYIIGDCKDHDSLNKLKAAELQNGDPNDTEGDE